MSLCKIHFPLFGIFLLSCFAAFGQAGVDRSLEILRAELETTMRSMGTPTVKSITRAFVQRV